MSDIKKAAAMVLKAWEDFQKFGSHEGECDFDPPCPKCGAPQGVCTHHSKNMKIRTEVMDIAVKNLTDVAKQCV